MVRLPPKKGPRMTRLPSRAAISHEDAERLELEAELDASADKVFNAIERARSKMTDTEREQADRNAAAILKNAIGSAERSRRRA
jgi:hypothetical protein